MAQPKSKKPESAVEALGELIQKLEALEKLTTLYEQIYPYGEVGFRGWNTGADKYWSKNIKPLVVEIELDLVRTYKHVAAHVKYEDQYEFIGGAGLILRYGDDLYSSILWVLGARKSTHIDLLILCMRKALVSAEMKAEEPIQTPTPDVVSKETDGQAEETKEAPGDEAKSVKKPTPAEKRAWDSYTWACEKHPDLVPKEGDMRYSEEMCKVAFEQSPYYHDEEGNVIARPNFQSWKRNITGYEQKTLSKPKNPPKDDEQAVREPRPNQDVDKLTGISSKYTPRGAD